MRILIDLQGAQTESRFRGIGRQTIALADALINNSQSHDIHVLINHRLHESREVLYNKYVSLLSKDNVHLFLPPGGTAERHEGNKWRTYASEYLREDVANRLNPDVLHISSLFEGFVDDAVTSIGKFDVDYLTSVTLHDLIPLVDPQRYLSELNPRRHWYRRAQFLKRADLILSVSNYSKNEAEKYLSIPSERIVTMLAGATAEFNTKSLNDSYPTQTLAKFGISSKYYLHVGAVDPRKNVEYIFQSIALMKSAGNNQIVFVGRLFDVEVARLKVAAVRNDIEVSRLVFCQYVSEAELVALYQRCEAVLFPSTHEGFGLPAIEGLACGALTFVANATSLPEVVGHEEFTFDPYEPLSLAEKLDALNSDAKIKGHLQSLASARTKMLTWDNSAKIAINAFEDFHARKSEVKVVPVSQYESRRLLKKPKLVFISPLPGIESGIAAYSSKLVRELACFYEIECVGVPGVEVKDEWILANFTLRDIGYFERNYRVYDVVLYSVGNNSWSMYMLPLISRFPGFVLLHDFYLSDLYNWASGERIIPYEDFYRVLYKTHGIPALLEERKLGREFSISKYSCNAEIFENALGVFVHSEWAREEAKKLYGAAVEERIKVVPHLKSPLIKSDGVDYRSKVHMQMDDVVVCSFGHITERKRSREIVDAWISSSISLSKNAHLIFVGAVDDSEYGREFKRVCDEYEIKVTGYVNDETYISYLHSANMAVQLRKETRGETSGAILDCFASFTPVVVDGEGPFSELPKELIVEINNGVNGPLSTIFDALASDASAYDLVAKNALDYILKNNSPALVGREFYKFFTGGQLVECFDEKVLVRELADFNSSVYPGEDDFSRTARSIAFGRTRPRLRQIFYDVTVLAESDAKTGIQRVVRAILSKLLEDTPPGYRVEPVRIDGHALRYARKFTTESFDAPTWVFPDSEIDYDQGDIYLSIDWIPDRLQNIEGLLIDFRRAGGNVVICAHDLLPLELPQFFPKDMDVLGQNWLKCVLRVSDQIVCVSRTTADQIVKYSKALSSELGHDVAIDHFPLAADIDASLPSKGIPADAEVLFNAIAGEATFLMVGTIEPRKGHRLIVAAFRRMWRQGLQPRLIIVGKQGWMMEEFCEELKNDPNFGKQLFWLSGISDEYLEELYTRSTSLIAASEGEGFGLPIVEAALHRRYVIARDIPVFREVAGDCAYYFSGTDDATVADEISMWIGMYRDGLLHDPALLAISTWRESTDHLLKVMFADKHYAIIEKKPLPLEMA